MTEELATLRAIKESEEESKKRIEQARIMGAQIVIEAKERAKKIISGAEEESKRAYDQYLKKEMEATSLEIVLIKKKFEEEAGKLKKEISKEVIEKMAKIIMEDNR
ncbi:MAG: hypothetical protein M0Z77_11790 [Thermoplasmatales archaeon]|nr:hypothetical protein [Thermoplasmatales archaeon]